MPTWRCFNKAAFNSGLYEAEDVLHDTEEVDLILLQPARALRMREYWQRLFLYRDPTNKLMFMNPGLRRVQLTQDYELFVVVCQSYWDLLYVNAIDGWQERCGTKLCWIDELWAKSAHKYKNWLMALDNFDHICVGSKEAASVLTRLLGRECHWVPGAVDALRFSPYPVAPDRVIDVYSIGRRWPGMHRALYQWASSKGIFYMHDTLMDVASMNPIHAREHRELYANVAKRSRYYVVAPAKMDLLSHTEGESEIGFRYYEGAAAGAVLVGQKPTCAHFIDMFGWQDSVVEVDPDGSNIVEVLTELGDDRERVQEISRRNAVESLLRHDWIYRWREIFRIAGLSPSQSMIAREKRLQECADLATLQGHVDMRN